MVSDPETESKKWIEAGASRIIVHLESLKSRDDTFIYSIKEQGLVKIGMAIRPNTDLLELKKYLKTLDFVQFMGIQNVGFQGEPFETKILDMIRELRAENPELEIAVDGGVNFETIKSLVDAGANRLSVGSTIFESISASETINSLRQVVE